MGGSPIFFFRFRFARVVCSRHTGAVATVQAAQQVVDTVLSGLGYELVDLEWGAGGVLRVFIDTPSGISIEDCERVSNQLSHTLTVENVDYERLEVSSPGLDRPLKQVKDFARYAGHRALVKFRQAVNGRKQFEGILQPVVGADARATLGMVFVAQDKSEQLLQFTLGEVDRARLVPEVDFGGHKR